MSRGDEATGLQEQAKRPRTAIAGPYGHPFHPMIVTIPIGTWLASVVFDIVALSGVEPRAFALTSQWLIAIGVIGAAIAACFGLIDLSGIPSRTRAKRTGLLHLTFNTIALILFIVSFIIRAVQGPDPSVVGFILSIIGLIVVGVSGYLGGELAYRYGVRVADEGTQRAGYYEG
ncbi:DUF2231 domain-containing protein [Rathayibacter sp. KR2-224]|uniref:DUF2231 domain-containing protein n=1 Tax=Rathayibacter sp. KR2-224 TaxID=3400913 RepID=UPI003BFB8D30